MRATTFGIAFGAMAVLSVTSPAAYAGQGLPNPDQAPKAVAPAVEVGKIVPSLKFQAAGYAVGGAGLRNRAGAALNVSGVTPPMQAGLLYWAVISAGTPPAAAGTVTIQRRLPTVSPTVTVSGVGVGSGASPCWAGDTITVYRGRVPLNVASGNGTYQVGLATGASGQTDGADPWSSSALPLMEGVSLVLIGTGTGSVDIFDKGLSGKTFGVTPGDTLSYSLSLSAAARSSTRWDNIGADGQWGSSVSANAATSSETTTVNGVAVAGPGSPYNDSDWNGNAAGPLPQLWDNTAHDISSAATGLQLLPIKFTTQADCLTPVANIVGRF